AAWMVDLAARDVAGTFNACPAFQWRTGTLVAALREAAPSAPLPAWVADDVLVAHGVAPWTGLPLWLPASDTESAGFMTMNCARAKAAGLATRPLADTIADTAAWLATRDNADAWKHVLTADAERTLLES
ncbi:MAG TPA: oxidoreductase, partial [Casimicrobiaceae bacterium]|nr:oxidoreductase [Casimicrobiaceae bacterium]